MQRIKELTSTVHVSNDQVPSKGEIGTYRVQGLGLRAPRVRVANNYALRILVLITVIQFLGKYMIIRLMHVLRPSVSARLGKPSNPIIS